MPGKKIKLKPGVIVPLLEHLRNGGTREGACGRAGISTSTFRRWLCEIHEFAGDVELAELEGKARDERMLDEYINEGDRVALTFRMKSVHGYGLPETGKKVKGGGEKMCSKEYRQVAEAIERLSPEERKELAGTYREPGKSGGKGSSKRADQPGDFRP
ncbi:MAG: hypothetical protein U9P14_12330 [Gemmatimonadota bacterium]|nr:hypothetical protein [Gemmatimonadota bacterium]